MMADLASYFSFVSLTLSRQMLTYDRRIPLPELDRRIEVRRQNSGFTISGDPSLYCTIRDQSLEIVRSIHVITELPRPQAPLRKRKKRRERGA